jgi:hypothetical protein
MSLFTLDGHEALGLLGSAVICSCVLYEVGALARPPCQEPKRSDSLVTNLGWPTKHVLLLVARSAFLFHAEGRSEVELEPRRMWADRPPVWLKDVYRGGRIYRHGDEWSEKANTPYKGRTRL